MKKTITTLLICMGFMNSGWSQNSLYFMDNLPQRIYSNPALMPEIKFFINLPSISTDLYNSGFNYNQFNEFSEMHQNENYNPVDFLNQIGTQNTGNAEARINLLDIGYKLNDLSYFTVSLSQRNFLDIQSSPEIVYFLTSYDEIKDIMPIEIRDVNINLNSFSQLAVTFSHKINKSLTLGISPKITGGIIGGRAKSLRANLSYDIVPDSYDSYIDWNEYFSGEVMVGLPVSANERAINSRNEVDRDKGLIPDDYHYKFFNSFRNPGFALDLGASYDLGSRWSFSASLLDIGYTQWNKSGYHFSLKDSIITLTSENTLKMKLPVKLFFAGSYNIDQNWNAGMVVRNIYHDSRNYASTTFSLNGYVFRLLSTTISYTKAHSFNTFGGGIRLRILPLMDFFAVTDNINHLIKIKDARHVNVSAGINLAYGIKR